MQSVGGLVWVVVDPSICYRNLYNLIDYSDNRDISIVYSHIKIVFHVQNVFDPVTNKFYFLSLSYTACNFPKLSPLLYFWLHLPTLPFSSPPHPPMTPSGYQSYLPDAGLGSHLGKCEKIKLELLSSCIWCKGNPTQTLGVELSRNFWKIDIRSETKNRPGYHF